MFRIPPRGRHITQEPQTIAGDLLGRSLATFRRRVLAYLLDAVLFGLVTGSLFLALTSWSFHREDPTLFRRVGAALNSTSDQVSQQDRDRVLADLYYMILERCPKAFSRDLAEMVRARDMQGLHEHFDTVDSVIGLGSGKTRTIENDDGSQQVVIGLDLVMGRFAGVLGWAGMFVAWFTLWTLITSGRSPGKALVRIRVVRLDGKEMRLWDCFSRSAGYSASAATLLLGFLEVIWDPNRQAIHDKIAGTVVVRE